MSGLIETLLKFGESLLACAEIESALPNVLDLVIQDTHAERGRIELCSKNGNRPLRAAREKGRSLDPDADHISSKILRYVKKTRRSFISPNAMDDEKLTSMLGSSKTIFEQSLRSVACVPLRDEDGIFGVIYIDNRSRTGLFDDDIGKKLQRLADLMARPLRQALSRALERRKTQKELITLRHQVEELQDYFDIIGESKEIQEIKYMIDVLKDFDEFNILITGETGTGKELVARMLHRKSRRANKLFIKYDCAGRSRDLLESELFGHKKGAFTGAIENSRGHIGDAEGGTLFLDEIGNLTRAVQMKLLHFLHNKTYTPVGMTEERRADVWLIMATNKDLKKLKDDGKLMEDIYYRIDKSRRIHVPPLRQRKGDIPALAAFILKRYNQRHNTHYLFADGFVESLKKHPYPGNFRQLDKYVNDAIFNAHLAEEQTVLPEHLPLEFLEDARTELALQHLQPVSEDFYATDLPDNNGNHPFITGLQARPRDLQIDAGGASFPLHDHLLIAIDKAAGIPLLRANEFVLKAFERNFLLAARGRCEYHKEVIAELGIDKSTYFEKLKRHGFHTP